MLVIRLSQVLRTLIVLPLIFLPFRAQAQPSQLEGPDDALRHTIRSREERIAHAMGTKDEGPIEALLAPDYVLRGSPDVDRATWIRNAVTMCWGSRFDIDHFHVRAFDGVAVASFELTFFVDPSNCHPAVLRSVITDIWVQNAGGWQLLVRHAGPPPATSASVAAQYGLMPEPPPIWDVSSELSLVATAGNTDTRTLGAGTDVLHRQDKSSTHVTFGFLSTSLSGRTQARTLTADLRQAFQFSPHLQAFGEEAFQRDTFAGLVHRATTSGGLGWTAPLPHAHTLTMEGSGGYTVEKRTDGQKLGYLTASGAVHYKWAINRSTQLKEDVALNADLQTAGNWRGTSTTALTVSLTRVLSLKASHAIDYRHAPTPGFKRLDMRTDVALVFAFQKRPALH